MFAQHFRDLSQDLPCVLPSLQQAAPVPSAVMFPGCRALAPGTHSPCLHCSGSSSTSISHQSEKKPNINITRLYRALISIFVIFKIVGKSRGYIQVGPIPLFVCLGFNYLGRNLLAILGLCCSAVTKSVLGLFTSKSVFCKAWHLHIPLHQGEFQSLCFLSCLSSTD